MEWHLALPLRYRERPESALLSHPAAVGGPPALCPEAAFRQQAYSMTSSAPASSDCGTAMPTASAVFRLIANTYFVGSCTGRSPGYAPLRIRSTYEPTRRYISG